MGSIWISAPAWQKRTHLSGATLCLVFLFTVINPCKAFPEMPSSAVSHLEGIGTPGSLQSKEDHQGLKYAGYPSAGLVLHGNSWGDAAEVSDYRTWWVEKMNHHKKELYLEQKKMPYEARSLVVTSSAPGSPWDHSALTLMPSWVKRLFRRAVPHPGVRAVSSAGGVTFQKCAAVDNHGDPSSATITLLTNNPAAPSSAMNLFSLSLSDNISGLVIQSLNYSSNATINGVQIFRKDSLSAGDFFSISYVASLNATDAKDGLKYPLPAVLTFHNSTEVSGSTFTIEAPFTITAEETVSPNHGLHAVGFIVAFILSFLIICGVLLLLYYIQKIKPGRSGKSSQNNGELKKELPAKAVDGAAEDLGTTDRWLDIIAFEEPDKMLQALDDAEIANLTQADAYLEACRVRISKDVTEILLRDMTGAGTLTSLEERKMRTVMSGQWTDLEKRIQEERHRKMVALTAECNLDSRKQMEAQQLWQKQATEEGEGTMKHAGEKSITEYRSLLDKLHGLEQSALKRQLLLKQEKEFAKAYRQLAITHRTELHKIYFDQAQSSMKAKPDAQRTLIDNYLKVQEESEDLIDFLQTTKKYHLNKRLAVRKNLLYHIQLSDSHNRYQLNSTATQMANLITRTERAGYISDSQGELLLERAQSEVLKVKQKLENLLKQETRKLHQKLTAKRTRHILQKLRDQKKELASVQEMCRTSREVQPYLDHWRKLFSNHCRELEELYERHDNEVVDELKQIKYSLTEKAIEDLRNIQSTVIIPDMLKLNVPRLHLQQALEEQKREAALLAQQLEKEENDKAGEWKLSLESTMRKLDEELKLNLKEQKNLRHWELLLFLKVLLLPLCVSEEDLHKIKQEFHCGFSQMDITLALPKVRGRLLLQKYQSDWRSAEIQKIEHLLLEAERQSGSKTTKHPQDRAAEIQKKSAEDKVLIYEAQITDDKIKQARAELLLQRVHQLKTREYTLGEYLTSLQFQMVNNKSKTLAAHSALLHLHSLLLEEETTVGYNTSEYEQLLSTLPQEIQEMDKNLETWRQRKTTVSKQALNESPVTIDVPSDEAVLPVSATLRKALNRRKHLTSLLQDRMQREEMECAMAEEQEERAQMCNMQRLHEQDIRLAAYLAKRSLVPEGMLQRVLSLLLPASSESEISSLLQSLGHKYSDRVTETVSNDDGADSCRKRRPEQWTAMEKRLRERLTSSEEEKNVLSPRKKRSILKKKKLRPVKRVSFSHSNNLTKLLQTGARPHPFGSAESLNASEVEETLCVFRVPSQTPSPTNRPKKKRSFLNSKKSAAVLS
ncbi:limbin isoform X2 [Hyperolius riggenbachi]|uniref:limbin isoform X2 n=1 Tax=Hyperolius riggenbachi TaxID=752182 RepID=UPI0035A283A4